MMSPPRFAVIALDPFERRVDLRLPFRFGAATVHTAAQAFVRARIVTSAGHVAEGWAAELMIPKWFDKNPARTNDENLDDLRASVRAACELYAASRIPDTAFGHAVRHYLPLIEAGAAAAGNALTACYGSALVDRALLDAACRAQQLPFAAAVQNNLPGLDARLTPDLAGFDLDAFLGSLVPQASIAARHTVGLADALDADDAPADTTAPDALPVRLDGVIARYGHRHFKLKLTGDVAADLARLGRIARVLDQSPLPYVATLDGNEQFDSPAAVGDMCHQLARAPALRRLAGAVAFVEQPLARGVTFSASVADVARGMPLLIDEADATLDAFPRARAFGYGGVSSKSCKGAYKSLLNAARVARWNAGASPGPTAFLSAEDLTSQAGLAVQQDLALVGLLGLAHVERNGHHYVDGFAGQHASLREARAFLAAHPDLYGEAGTHVRLRIEAGRIDLRSLAVTGYGAAVWPDTATLAPMAPSS